VSYVAADGTATATTSTTPIFATTSKKPGDNCPEIDCGNANRCTNGYKLDKNGCQTCQCKDIPGTTTETLAERTEETTIRENTASQSMYTVLRNNEIRLLIDKVNTKLRVLKTLLKSEPVMADACQ